MLVLVLVLGFVVVVLALVDAVVGIDLFISWLVLVAFLSSPWSSILVVVVAVLELEVVDDEVMAVALLLLVIVVVVKDPEAARRKAPLTGKVVELQAQGGELIFFGLFSGV